MKAPISLVVAAAALALAACGKQAQTPTATAAAAAASDAVIQLPAGGTPLETINGVAVPQSLLTAIAKGRNMSLSNPQQRQQALDELQQYVLLAQQAPLLKVRQQADLAATVEISRLQGMANAVLLAYARANPITDAQLQKEYQEQVTGLGDKTYQITQLMFADQETANKAAAELKAGTAFDKVFEQFRGQARDARSFPTVFLKQLPPELAAVVAALSPGHATTTPVKTAYGWHLIFLNKIDAFTPPPLAQVSDKLRQDLEQKQAQAYIEALKANARISLVAPANAASLAPGQTTTTLDKAVRKQAVKQAPTSTSPATH
ncbi:MAG TPA: peptidylprolyl isomerase [Rhodanobacteraceae bacterium]|nr:peptidylprolyl isomerase [Rhodanobacteraceae bacterium]